ncbi:alpha/beta hydrolase fold domain-containing protein [Actinotignum sanguinis]|uniref:Alpha/beta hydrolase fold domain-containing protein n=2 Tax=Actinomycetaceae TaxID=2049 RepID=A0ABZ0RDN8_9ACTO|nr:alpha/beta hydrolase fold domain-containing protein [Actinotignum sanguinis]WPJ89102.1 alpha/beta hydrolase fold domain-containing protein [Schaalia turicensis]MDE1552772.1 alpha/beta hydrolase fold domain-containing protein [Actinotignum sanguinis]MDE1564705.1 alpha/beta hydrolase fold domain-containing protein [Actinotignum sanguinis]MDE1576740.1 alpha/beta hydrolase fold domain-containing protein [Actinotignum sanguinis]MDE1642308.1 alpha/beta hydrolase fold domain-containing protein [Ac
MASPDVRLSAAMRAALAQDARLALPHCGHGEPVAMQARYEAEHRWWNEGGSEVAWHAEQLSTRHGVVPVRFYRPGCRSLSPAGSGTTTQFPAGATRPIIVYLHGGSYCVGSPATHDRLTRELAAATGCVVVSVDYTLAPRARYPRISEECEDAVVELARRYPGYPIVLAGDSCGATLSLGTWWRLARRAGEDGAGADACQRAARRLAAKPIVALVLYYGEYGLPAAAVPPDSVSGADGTGGADGMSPADRAYYDSLYFSSPTERAAAPDIALLRTELRGCPPVFLAAGECDPLVADTRALAAHLEARAVRTHLEVVPGVMHAFLQRVRLLPEAERIIAHTAAFLADVLDRSGGRTRSNR